MWQKSDFSTVTSRGELFLFCKGKPYKYRDMRGDRGGGMRQQNQICSYSKSLSCRFQPAFRSLSGCSYLALK